jgi:DNA-binding GntR family transcriptional regulator
MPTRTVSRETLAGQLEAALREDILGGSLPPGTWLRQSEIAERYGVSQTPLREALQKLAATGLVVLDPMAGAYVSPISNADLVDIYTLRSVLEPLAIQRSVERADDEWLDQIKKAEDDLRVATARDQAVRASGASGASDPGAPLAWTRAHRAFHRVLMSRSDSRWLASFIETLWLHSERYSRSASAGGRDVDAEHKDIFAAACRLDSRTAAESVRRHLEAAAASRSVAPQPTGGLAPEVVKT